ncbi:MAG TPA: Gfo/Idh/MocA family oxidoreductase [Vicinamibacterales bacterium]|nr:Gfo/Idh/MocA family oxidoreductase [Vicinamibacterales bacterium]
MTLRRPKEMSMGITDSKLTRRDFLGAAAGVALLSATPAHAWKRVQGANDRVRMALIGCGNRGGQVTDFFLRHQDMQFVAACDVFKERLDARVNAFARSAHTVQAGSKVDAVEDYRRVLDRKDVDAVFIATPDHWHCDILTDAIKAGKDVYVEKPLSNTIERAVSALKAYRGSNRVVQLGTQQRSGPHFQEAAEIVQSGKLGKVTHAVLLYPGTGYGRGPEEPTAPPAGLNWDMFQGPAPRHPYKVGRHRSWRGYWDYGGGLITDWGVHLTDVALWYLEAQSAAPLLTSGSAQYVNLVNPERDQSPDSFSVTWQYPEFVMTFTNILSEARQGEFDRRGNYFYGPQGSLLVNRVGYEMRPRPQRAGGAGRRGAGAPAAAGTAPAPAPALTMPFEYTRKDYAENYQDDPHTIAHTRNFLDCVKSRRKPVSDLEIGFHASLPCILGVMAVRQGRSFKWDAQALKAVPV